MSRIFLLLVFLFPVVGLCADKVDEERLADVVELPPVVKPIKLAVKINDEPLSIVVFSVESCVPCLRLERHLDSLKVVYSVHICKDEDFKTFNITRTPTTVVYRGDVVVGRILGYEGKTLVRDLSVLWVDVK